jgi:hypothetical protein
MSIDCRFVASDAGTVHEQRKCHVSGREYRPRPKCGQTLPLDSEWSRVDADSQDDLVERFDLALCTKCFGSVFRARGGR